MAKTIKDRSVYGLVNFRGLDKENKPLKVSPFRAVDGSNFIIDSETLKTRPGFKYVETPLKNLGEEDYIIDYYNFRGVYIYITNKNIQFKYNNKVLNTSNTMPRLITNITLESNFEGLKPLFQEEKDCLFIFCLNNVFVVSNLINESNGEIEYVVFYELNSKPTNTFSITNSYYKPFEDLPIPYEPTLYIGDNFLDDVNLLSNVSKYKLFAKNNMSSQGGINTYILPTHYDKEKNGDFNKENYEISFYDGEFSDLEIFPVYMGKENEDFGNILFYGPIIDGEINIHDVYVAKEIFEYLGEKDGENPPTPIKEILGLSKEDFFNFRIEGENKTVFEYLLWYIKNNQDSINENKVLKFKLPYERTSYYRDIDTNEIKKVYKEQREEYIYVQLKKYDLGEVFFTNKDTREGAYVNETNYNNDYPSYPTFPNVVDLLIDITPEPIERKNFTRVDFTNFANEWLESNKEDSRFTNNKKIKLIGRLYETKNTNNNVYVNPDSDYNNWLKSDVYYDIGDTSNPNNYPPVPSFDNPNHLPVIDIGFLSKSGQNTEADEFFHYIRERILLYYMNQLPNNEGTAFCIFRWYSYWDIQDDWHDKGQTVVCQFYYANMPSVEFQKRNSFAMYLTILRDEMSVKENLYNFVYDEEKGAFVLKIKDYFYDFNNEPSINVKVKFTNNPDYEIISKSKFGIPFGSENRLFLAGNEKYPNIDRYNVSNDLLGDNIANQSYELSYFPSRNYRVLGGKGAINGYVIATDTQLYITKKDYPNDQKLFIRNRTMDENGLVGYNEFKTNIDKTPLNNNCIVRFYNDILMLDNKGLHGVEISSNVLTNERLLKMRSGFINKELINQINNYDNSKIFIYEDNFYMYIFIGNKVYVADSRYISHNPNSEIENYSYEIVEWDIPFEVRMMKKVNGEIIIIDKKGHHIYTIKEDNNDDFVERITNYLYASAIYADSYSKTSFFMANNYFAELLNNPEKISIKFEKRIFKLLAFNQVDYTIYDNIVTVLNDRAFRDVVDGDKLYYMTDSNVFKEIEVRNFDEYNRDKFYGFMLNGNSPSFILVECSDKILYPKIVFNYENFNRVILSPYKQDEIKIMNQEEGESDDDYIKRVKDEDDDYCGYYFEDELLKDIMIYHDNIIKLKWISSILDFGNNFNEKTMFKTNIYATKQQEENWIKLGYRTMRRLNRFDETGQSNMMKGIEVSNPINLDEINFNIFAINTLNEKGSSIPMKENNFLYIQFIVIGEGNIELNAIEILYKLNRLLKTSA